MALVHQLDRSCNMTRFKAGAAVYGSSTTDYTVRIEDELAT